MEGDKKKRETRRCADAENSGYRITREQVVEAARTWHGTPFRHQGRNEPPGTGIDCVGLLVVVAKMLEYPEIIDVEGYRRVPSADTIKKTLLANCDEIPIDEVKAGDIYLMRLGGRKPRHAAIRISDETDLARGIEPQIIHAFAMGPSGQVIIESVRQRMKDVAAGFRLRGLV